MAPDSPWFEGFDAGHHDVGGIRLFARCGGRADAPPMLLLHGFPQTHAMWHRVARQLAPHFRLVLPDLRGYGDSDKPPGSADHANYSSPMSFFTITSPTSSTPKPASKRPAI